MSQRLTTSFINTNIPGAYPNVTVQSNPVGVSSSGIVLIMGEADGGPSYQNTVLANNVFTPDQLSMVQNIYTSGQIVDAFTALSAPSNDANITGTANLVYIIKTNSGSAASAVLAPSYGTLSAQTIGVAGNNFRYQITNVSAEVAPAIDGGTVPVFGAPLNGDSFSLRLNGGAASTVTLGVVPADHADITSLVTELNTLLPSGVVASAGVVTNSVELTVTADATAPQKGFAKSLELIDSTPGDLAALGLAPAFIINSQQPEIEIVTSNSATGFSQTLDVTAAIALSVGYAGTSGTMTIASGLLTTTVVGGTGANLNIVLSNYRTVADLATFIDSQTGYSATAAAAVQQLAPSVLDTVSAIGIAATSTTAEPGQVLMSAFNFQSALATSTALAFAPTATAGLPTATASPIYLTGGTRGATLAIDIVNAIAQMAGIQLNMIVPLFSQDASKDITAGLTDPSSTYTIAAINALIKSHCIEFSTPALKHNRIAVLSILDTYLNGKAQAQDLANFRCSLTIQSITQVNSQGVITSFQPWYGACIAAGMQAGGFYKSITNKLANVISFADPVGFDSGSPGDIEDALSAGLLILTQITAGSLWVSDQTTYGFDTNFVYNSIQAVYDSDLIALDLAASFQAAFVGQSVADINPTTALSFLAQKMLTYIKQKLIASSADAPLGYKNQSVQITPPTMTVNVEIKLATAIYFIPINLNISQVQLASS